MSHDRERLLPQMTKPGLIRDVLQLDPKREEEILNGMDTEALMHLIFSLERELGLPAISQPEPLDKILISTADKDARDRKRNRGKKKR